VRGDVFIDLTTDRDERVAAGSRLWTGDRWVTVIRSSRSNKRWRVHLDGFDDRKAAATLTGLAVFAEPSDDPDVLWVHDLIGAQVVEVDGTDRGRCIAVVANPAADLLELDSHALVPINFVTAVDTAGDVIVTIDPPAGLFDLSD
jgi:16S rRNA processing protein RimM